jgi:hypothetical protein
MPAFVKGGAAKTPFGKNVYLRSTAGLKFESYTVAASTVRAQTIDGFAGQKILQPGTVLAKITSGGDSGKVGPFHVDASVTDGRQTAANIVGINDTFLPWQLIERDVEVAALYNGAVVQANCIEYGGTLTVATEVPLTTAAALTALQGGTKGLLIILK